MSRSGYSDDCSGWDQICWRGAVKSALKGRRGQAFLVELRDALDAMPGKRLIANSLEVEGEFCTLGVIGVKRGVDMAALDPDDREALGGAFGISPVMASEIVFMNDEACWQKESPEQRWLRMRDWVESNIRLETL